MSLESLLLFAVAMISAVLGRFLDSGAMVAYAVCLVLLIAVVLFARHRGLRGPVV